MLHRPRSINEYHLNILFANNDKCSMLYEGFFFFQKEGALLVPYTVEAIRITRLLYRNSCDVFITEISL